MALGALGEVVAGKYELGRVLGEGGMGIVYEATHVRLRQRVAIKMLKPEATSREFLARFEREARAAAQISGPHVTKVLDVDVARDGTPFIVMELLDGQDLGQELLGRGVMSIADACDYVQQAANGLEQAHGAGIVHRDIKPANLFLCALRGTERKLVKLVDFGISKVAEEDETKNTPLTETFTTFGTAIYMSPEQMRSAKTVDARSDIWSLGIILYQLLVGRPPFTGSGTAVASAVAADPVPKPREQRADIPEVLEEVILKALEKDPAKRYQTARQLADALTPFAPWKSMSWVLASIPPPSAQVVSAPSLATPAPVAASSGPRRSIHDDPTSAAPPVPSPRRSSSALAITVASVAAVATAAGITFALGAFRASPPSPAGASPPAVTPETAPAAASAGADVAAPPAPESPTSATGSASATAGTEPSRPPLPARPPAHPPASATAQPPAPTSTSRTPLHI